MSEIDVSSQATLQNVDRGNRIGLNYSFNHAVTISKDITDNKNYYVKFSGSSGNGRYIPYNRKDPTEFTVDPNDSTKKIATAYTFVAADGDDKAGDTLTITADLFVDDGSQKDGPKITSLQSTKYGFIDLGSSATALLTPVNSYAEATPAPAAGTPYTTDQAVELRLTLPAAVTVPALQTLGIDVVIGPIDEQKITILDFLALVTGSNALTVSTPIGNHYCIKIKAGETKGSVFVASDHVTMLSARPAASVSEVYAFYTGISKKEVSYPGAIPVEIGDKNTVSVNPGDKYIDIKLNDGQNFTDNDNLSGYEMTLIVNETKFTNQQSFTTAMSPFVSVPILLFQTGPNSANGVQYIFVNKSSGRIFSSEPVAADNKFKIINSNYQNAPDPTKSRQYESPGLDPQPVGKFINWDLVSTSNGLDVTVPKSVNSDKSTIKVNVYFNGWNGQHGVLTNALLDQPVADGDANNYKYKISKDNLTGYGYAPGGGYSTMQVEYYTSINGDEVYSGYVEYKLDTVP